MSSNVVRFLFLFSIVILAFLSAFLLFSTTSSTITLTTTTNLQNNQNNDDDQLIDFSSFQNMLNIIPTSDSDDDYYDMFFRHLKTETAQVTTAKIACQYEHHNKYWDHRQLACLPLEGVQPPLLHPFEISGQELHCRNKRGNWKSFPFRTRSSVEDFFLQNAEVRNDKRDKESLNRIYNNFKFSTSWLFREWKDWTPRPRLVHQVDSHGVSSPPITTSTTSILINQVIIKGQHDPELENLFTIENFCVDPFDGISGFFDPKLEKVLEEDPLNRLKPFIGKDDTRNFYHGEKTFTSFFNPQRITRLKKPPIFFDERPVIFIRVAPLARFHIYHTLNKFLSVLGMIRLLRQKGRIGSSVDDDNDDELSKPLIIFVNEPVDDGYDSSKSAAWAFFYQLLYDFPWASVSVPENLQRFLGTKMSPNDVVSNRYHEKMFNLTGHYFTTKGRSENNFHEHKDHRVCFLKGFISHNCFDCSHVRATSGANGIGFEDQETESFSFGMWQQANDDRIWMAQEYRRLIDERCLIPVFSSFETTKKRQKQQQQKRYRLPQVFFALRSKSRIIRDLPLYHEYLRFSLSDFVSSINFREPWQKMTDEGTPQNADHHHDSFSSRLHYTNDVRSKADIFVGLHGGDFGMVSLAPKNAVVVELTFNASTCTFSNQAGNGPRSFRSPLYPKRCWFGIFADASIPNSTGDHWMVFLNRYESPRRQLTIPPHVLVDTLRDASCRWLTKKYGDDDEDLKELLAWNTSSMKNIKYKTSLLKVAKALSLCAHRHDSTKTLSTETKQEDWNQQYREIYIHDLDSTLNERYLKFLWFELSDGRMSAAAQLSNRFDSKKSDDPFSTIISNLKKLVASVPPTSSFQQRNAILFSRVSLFCSPRDAMVLWRMILNRLLSVDEGNTIFGCRQDELRPVRVLEASSDVMDGKVGKLFGCLPFADSSSEKEDLKERCLYVVELYP